MTKIFCFCPFAHFLIFYFWHFSDALYAQVHGKMEARALLTEAVSVGVFRRCCNSSDLGWRDQQTMAVLYHRRNNQQDCFMGFWIVFSIADICTGVGTLFPMERFACIQFIQQTEFLLLWTISLMSTSRFFSFLGAGFGHLPALPYIDGKTNPPRPSVAFLLCKQLIQASNHGCWSDLWCLWPPQL